MCTCTHSPRLSQQQSLVPSFWCVEPMFQLCSAAEWKWPLVQAPVRFIKIKTRCWRTWRPAQLNILLLAKWNAVWNGHVNDTFCLCWLPCCIGWFSGHSTITCCHNGTGGCYGLGQSFCAKQGNALTFDVHEENIFPCLLLKNKPQRH